VAIHLLVGLFKAYAGQIVFQNMLREHHHVNTISDSQKALNVSSDGGEKHAISEPSSSQVQWLWLI
jgi:hypothetical protein